MWAEEAHGSIDDVTAREFNGDVGPICVGSVPSNDSFACNGNGVGEIGNTKHAGVVSKKVLTMWGDADGSSAVDNERYVCGCVCCVALRVWVHGCNICWAVGRGCVVGVDQVKYVDLLESREPRILVTAAVGGEGKV